MTRAALVRLGRARRPVAVAGLASFGLLVLTGVASDAVANSEELAPRLLPRLGRPGLWAAVALTLAGAALAPRRRPSEGR
jgi:hypothetical protein